MKTKIQSVTGDNRRRRFDVRTRRGDFAFPYAKCDPPPSPDDRLVEVYVDPELAGEGFTYRLESGIEGSVMGESVLDYNADPAYLAELELYRLTLAAKQRFESSGLSVRDVAARLGTSPPQLYRLLDTTNYSKSARQLLALLALLGAEVAVIDRHAARATGGGSLAATLRSGARASKAKTKTKKSA